MSWETLSAAVGRLVCDGEFRTRLAGDPSSSALDGLGLDAREREAFLRIRPPAASAMAGGSDHRISQAVSLWYGDSMGSTASAIPNVGYTRLAIHQLMLSDVVRVNRYREAIRQVVRPGDTVLDLGTGSGILAFFAAEAGASKVFAVERERIAIVAREIAHKNGFSERVTVLHEDVGGLRLANPVDVLLSECIGSFGTNTTMIRSFFNARDRLLRSGGAVIPRRLVLYLAPVESLVHQWHLRSWERGVCGVDLSPAWPYAVNQMYTAIIDRDSLLASAVAVQSLDFSTAVDDDFVAEAQFTLCREGYLCGLGGWFTVDLAPGVTIDTSPHDTMTCWYQVFLPVDKISFGLPGDLLRVRIDRMISGDQIRWRWATEHVGRKETNKTWQDSRLSFPKVGLADEETSAGSDRSVGDHE